MSHHLVRLLAAVCLYLGATCYSFDITKTQNPDAHVLASMPAAAKTEIENQINTILQKSFDTTIARANEQLSGFKEQKELAKGMANANAYAVQSASFTGFQNYKLFALGTGLSFGIQAPSLDLDYYSEIGDEITDKGDLYAGIGAGFSLINIGVNAGKLFPGLYLNAKYGGLSFNIDDFKYDFIVFGIGANYGIIKSKSLMGFLKWRGVSLGTGLYHQSNTIRMAIEPDPISTDVPLADAVSSAEMSQLGLTGDLTMSFVPIFEMKLDINTTTIPIDATTGISMLFGILNFNAGAGFDLNFGSAEIGLEGNPKVTTTTPDPTKFTIDDAVVHIDGLSDNGPSLARLRFMAGFGLGLGPVKVNIQATYYLVSGVALGFSGLIVW